MVPSLSTRSENLELATGSAGWTLFKLKILSFGTAIFLSIFPPSVILTNIKVSKVDKNIIWVNIFLSWYYVILFCIDLSKVKKVTFN